MNDLILLLCFMFACEITGLIFLDDNLFYPIPSVHYFTITGLCLLAEYTFIQYSITIISLLQVYIALFVVTFLKTGLFYVYYQYRFQYDYQYPVAESIAEEDESTERLFIYSSSTSL